MEFGAKGFQITGLEFWSLVSHSFIHSFIPRKHFTAHQAAWEHSKGARGRRACVFQHRKTCNGPRVPTSSSHGDTDTCKLPATWLSRRFWETEWRGRRPPLAAPRPRAPAVIVGRAPGPRTRPGARAGRQVPRRSGDGRDAPFLLDGPRAVLNVSGNCALKAPRARPGRTSRPEARRPLAPGRAGGNGGPAAAAHLAPGDEGRRRVHRRVLRARRKSLCAASP